jgi:deoxyribonuclease-4
MPPKIGFHAPITGGLQNALTKSHELSCDTVQIFSRNPRGWAAKPLTDEEADVFKKARRKTKIGPVIIHCNYLVNLAAADETIRAKSIEAFRSEVIRGLMIGADYLVVHPGSAKGACEEDGIKTCAESLKVACEGIELGKFRILLENTAGQGACIGHRFEHLGAIMRDCKELNLGVCFDTAHAFTAGYDIREEEGLTAAMQSLDKHVGMRNVRAVHFNDSRADYNSRVDRHWHIGLGKIGLDGLRRVAQYPKLQHAAFILETPQDELGDDKMNLDKLRGFVS